MNHTLQLQRPGPFWTFTKFPVCLPTERRQATNTAEHNGARCLVKVRIIQRQNQCFTDAAGTPNAIYKHFRKRSRMGEPESLEFRLVCDEQFSTGIEPCSSLPSSIHEGSRRNTLSRLALFQLGVLFPAFQQPAPWSAAVAAR